MAKSEQASPNNSLKQTPRTAAYAGERTTMEEEDRIPRVIYLQWADRASPEGVTWCTDKINDDDIEYRMSVMPDPDSSHTSWDDVLRGLDGLYQCWANNDMAMTDEVASAFVGLLETYDKWLD